MRRSPARSRASGSTSWSGSNFGAPSDSLGGFTPACWIHVNANTVGTCPYGNGLYCGGDGVTGDPDTLYTCTGGVLTVDTVCAIGCTHMPNYVNDKCAACPKGDGTCGGAGVGAGPSSFAEPPPNSVVTPPQSDKPPADVGGCDAAHSNAKAPAALGVFAGLLILWRRRSRAHTMR